jgi:hypothetical protein
MVKINVGGKRRPLLLKKIRDDLYVTNPMSFDEALSDVGLIRIDPDHNIIDKIIPSVSETPDEGKMKFQYLSSN